MAKRVTVKHDQAGYIEVMQSPETLAALMEAAERVADRAGDGFIANPGRPGKTRTRAFVSASTWEAVTRDRRDAVLPKAIGGLG